jgi:hypothetical protein
MCLGSKEAYKCVKRGLQIDLSKIKEDLLAYLCCRQWLIHIIVCECVCVCVCEGGRERERERKRERVREGVSVCVCVLFWIYYHLMRSAVRQCTRSSALPASVCVFVREREREREREEGGRERVYSACVQSLCMNSLCMCCRRVCVYIVEQSVYML